MTLLIVALAATGAQLRMPKNVPRDVGPLVVTVVVLLTYLGSVRWIERRPMVEFAPRGAVRELFVGLLIGFALFASVMGILWIAGVYHPGGAGTAKGIAAGLALAIMSGVFEEILFRGILFRVSSRIVGTWGALLFTAAFFGLAHLGNKGATLSSGVAIMLEAGVLLGAAFAYRQTLATHRSAHRVEIYRGLGLWHVGVRQFARWYGRFRTAAWKFEWSADPDGRRLRT